jgi:6-pyruvoyltetrahydropterin/6-carboxytetrahydropterin synthase
MLKNNIPRFCTIAIKFDAGHRIIGHQGHCKYVHGHSYNIEITVGSNVLDDLGMVVDFGVLKKICEDWIKENFDHTIILSTEDLELGQAIAKITHQKVYYLDGNPTSENLATFFKYEICSKLFKPYEGQFSVTKVKLSESAKSWVEV